MLDTLIARDKQKIFHSQVKKKDAPNYYELIKRPVALMDMKTKAKREDYLNRDSFLEDLELMAQNAETYNGIDNPISLIARDLVDHAQEMIQQEDDNIKTYESLIIEQ